MRPSGIRPSLSSEDEEVKRKLVKCSPRTYSELIRSDIPRPSGAKPSRPSEPFGAKSSRSSEPSGAKSSLPSALRPSQSYVMKPSREELKAQVEFLVKKKRSAKCKIPVAPESIHAARGKVQKLGESSSPSSIREQGSSGQFWARGRTPPPVAEVSTVTGPQLHSLRAVVAKSPPGRTTEPPLDILPMMPKKHTHRPRTQTQETNHQQGLRWA